MLWGILKDEIADTDRHENHQEFFLTVLDRDSTADNFVLTFPTAIKKSGDKFLIKQSI